MIVFKKELYIPIISLIIGVILSTLLWEYILSDDDCMVQGVRQKPITKKKLAVWMEQPSDMANGLSVKWKRNQQLIDFECIPEEISTEILNQYNKEKIWDEMPGRLTSYFVKKKLNYLMEHKGDFVI